MAVIEWCKLFGEKNGKHYWNKVISNQTFEPEMLTHLNQTGNQFEAYIKEMRNYRDQFLAHLDDQLVANIPKLDLAMAAVEFYHGYLVHQETLANDLIGLPTDLTAYREQCSKEAILFLDLCKL